MHTVIWVTVHALLSGSLLFTFSPSQIFKNPHNSARTVMRGKWVEHFISDILKHDQQGREKEREREAEWLRIFNAIIDIYLLYTNNFINSLFIYIFLNSFSQCSIIGNISPLLRFNHKKVNKIGRNKLLKINC